MALVTCPDCQAPMSVSASTCLRCGRPTRSMASRVIGPVLLALGLGVLAYEFVWPLFR